MSTRKKWYEEKAFVSELACGATYRVRFEIKEGLDGHVVMEFESELRGIDGSDNRTLLSFSNNVTVGLDKKQNSVTFFRRMR